MQRIVSWFSCGAASAVASKLAYEENKARANPNPFVIANIYLKDEHPDSHRFMKDCEEWIGEKFTVLTNERYKSSVDEVIASTKYMSGARGARCTKELKKAVRLDWQNFDDIHVFGMTVEEQNRIEQLVDQENDIELWPILIEKGLTKEDCFDIIRDAGIELPQMYKLGYNNNNCIGCLKAQSPAYWNKIRRDFPETFDKMAEAERDVGNSCIRGVFLDELDPDAGREQKIIMPDCGNFCDIEFTEVLHPRLEEVYEKPVQLKLL